ncbi:MAG: macro domain-containing protein [Elusimicrobiales bacterium]|nr:macro domain-containing protein [Elusimicrobiales bacterium]
MNPKYLSPGSCVITPAYNIKNVKHIIHTVGPVWHGGNNGEPKTLMECYENCFKLALDNHIKTIAFPSVSTGAYGYPVEKASEIAISASIKNSGFFDTIILVAYSDYDLKVYEENFRRYEDR